MRNHNYIQQSITPSNENIERFMRDVRRHKVCSEEEVIALAEKIKQGDWQARNRLVETNMRLVITIAKRFLGRGVEFEDLLQSGSFGLIKAAERFDASKGFKFSTFAQWLIFQAIGQAINTEGRLVTIPHNQTDDLMKLNKVISRYTNLNGEMPTAEELAEMTGLKADKVEELLGIPLKHVSLDKPTDENDEDVKEPLINRLSNTADAAADFGLSQEEFKSEVARLLSTLDSRKATILKLYFGFDGLEHSLYEIATRLNKSSERVRQLKEEALDELRQKISFYPLAA